MKKKILLIVAFLISIGVNAQQGINYKAIIKDVSGNVVANDLVQVRFAIRTGISNPSDNNYLETHTPTTDTNGVVILNIGEGTVNSGVFADIDWASGRHFLSVYINIGEGFVDMGTTEFMSVPYAKHAQIAEKIIKLPEPYILGRSLISSNARFQFNEKHGWQAAQKMCEAAYPRDPNVRAFTLEQITQAIILGNYDETNLNSINQVRFWAITPVTYNVGNTYFASAHENNAHGLNINAGDSGRGTTGEIRIEDSTFIENGSNPFKTYLKVFNGVGPNANYPCMCGTYR
jgi:hypothetical protein